METELFAMSDKMTTKKKQKKKTTKKHQKKKKKKKKAGRGKMNMKSLQQLVV